MSLEDLAREGFDGGDRRRLDVRWGAGSTTAFGREGGARSDPNLPSKVAPEMIRAAAI
jgi:hypothetical protein